MLFSRLERLIAFRYLRARRKEKFVSVITALAFLGIAIGVATLIVVMSVMNGFGTELRNRILGINSHIAVLAYGGGVADFDEERARIAKLSDIQSVTPYIEGQVMATASRNSTGALVRGIRQSDLQAKTLIADRLTRGDLKAFTGRDAVIIGYRMAEMLGVTIGSPITLISPQGNATPIGMVPRMKTYQIVGIFDIGMTEYDSNLIYMPLEAAQVYFKLPNRVSGFEVMLKDINIAPQKAQEIAQELNGRYHVEDWETTNQSFFNALAVERVTMFMILTLIIVVAAFNIISSMVMLVKDKARDIAVLRTMGATRGSVMRIFFLTGATIGVVGTLGGAALGVAFAANIETIRQWVQTATGSPVFDPVIYFLSVLPSEIRPANILSIVGMGLGISFLATLYPAWKAARQDPSQVLRYE